MAVFLRVRVPSDAPPTVFQPKFRYVNGRHGNDHVTPVENNDVSVTEFTDGNGLRSTSDMLLDVRGLFETRYVAASAAAAAESAAASAGPVICSVERLLGSINDLLETRLRSDTELRHQREKDQQMMNEWMIAAAVIDRICFIVFSFVFAICTAVMFILATAVEH